MQVNSLPSRAISFIQEQAQQLQNSRIYELFTAVSTIRSQVSPFAYELVQSGNVANAQLYRDFAGTVLVAAQKIVKKDLSFTYSIVRSIRVGAVMGLPFAVVGVKNAVQQLAQGRFNDGAFNLLENGGWLMDIAATTLVGLKMSTAFTSSTAGKIAQYVTPFSLASAACSFVGALVQVKSAYDIDRQVGGNSLAAPTTQEFHGVAFDSSRHANFWKNRSVSKSFSNKLSALSKVVTLVGLGAAFTTCPPAVAPVLFAMSGLIQLGSVVYDKRAENQLKQDLGVPHNRIDVAIVAATVALIAVPTIILHKIIKE